MSNSRRRVLAACLFAAIFPYIPLAREFPRVLEPTHLADRLAEPEKSIRQGLADSLAQQQTVLLDAVSNSTALSLNEAMTALALALEEYWQRELSYPASSAMLAESGYFRDGWKEAGLSVADCGTSQSRSAQITLVYVPQPVGLAQIRGIPGQPCGDTRRAFNEYSVFIDGSGASEYGITSGLETAWSLPFRALGFVEVLHIDQSKPGNSGCASCP